MLRHHQALAGGSSTSELRTALNPSGHHQALAGGASISYLPKYTSTRYYAPHMNPRLTAPEAAYQLHNYLWFKTRYLQPLLASAERQLQATDIDVMDLRAYAVDYRVHLPVQRRARPGHESQQQRSEQPEERIAPGHFARRGR